MPLDLDGPIGLIADSHGRTDLLAAAIDWLEAMGVSSIIHLGDICDSLAPLALEDAVAVLQEHGVHALRGNNEYAILVNHQGERAGSLPAGVLRISRRCRIPSPSATSASPIRPPSTFLQRRAGPSRMATPSSTWRASSTAASCSGVTPTRRPWWSWGGSPCAGFRPRPDFT